MLYLHLAWLAGRFRKSSSAEVSDRPSNETISNTKNANITLQQTKTTSSVSKVAITGSSVIYKVLGTTELSNEIKKIIYGIWRTKTEPRYETVLKKWRNHRLKRNKNPYVADIKSVLMFLQGTYENGYLYSGICASVFMILMIFCSLLSFF